MWFALELEINLQILNFLVFEIIKIENDCRFQQINVSF